MQVCRRGFLGLVAAGAVLSCRAPTLAGPSPERPVGARPPVAPRLAATRAPFASASPPPATAAPADDGRGLERTIEFVLRQQRGSFGVAVLELAGPAAVEVGAWDRFTLASLYKVLLM